jgi:CubicO group peptidase (beta-lactamase class C family)
MMERKIISAGILLLIIGFCSGCLKSDELNFPFRSMEPKDIGDGLTISDPAKEGMDPEKLESVYKDVFSDENLWSLRSLLVFRNGNLISEAYPKDGNDITNKHIIWSCTKQVMGVLTGIAIDRGLIESENDPLSDYFDDELTDPLQGSITIRDLLAMQSGIDYDNEVQTDEILRQVPDNCVEYVFNRPVVSTPGTGFHYNDGNPLILSALIQKLTGSPADIFAPEARFLKIGLTNYNWVRYKDGVSLGGFGIETTPRELSKVALCVADGGLWKGEEVISSEWIGKMTSLQVSVPDFEYDFGYLWWIDESRGIYFMWGVGGQFAFVVPDQQLLVVMTSFPNTSGEYEIQANEGLDLVDRIIATIN